ncbi:MAG: class I SAM-dependent methyltransferase [Patescibacteria group bacterium]
MNFDKYILDKTREDYNLIGDKFSNTRHKPWQEFEFLFEDIPQKAKVLDLGCGNGRFFDALKEKQVDYIGLDKSEKLILKAKDKFPEANFEIGDGLNMPFADDYFDYVFSIAVLHHMPSEETRVQFLKEVKRVLKKNGEVRLSVWNLINAKKSIYFKNFKEKAEGKIGFRDAFIPWKNNKGKVVTERYYHFFKENELKKIAKKAGLKVEKVFTKGEGVKSNIFLFATNES